MYAADRSAAITRRTQNDALDSVEIWRQRRASPRRAQKRSAMQTTMARAWLAGNVIKDMQYPHEALATVAHLRRTARR